MKYYLYVIKIDYSYKRDLTKWTYKREGVVGGTVGSPT
jgi:hypothetical protein